MGAQSAQHPWLQAAHSSKGFKLQMGNQLSESKVHNPDGCQIPWVTQGNYCGTVTQMC